MHVLIIGGHGRTALLLGELLVAGGHNVTGTYRDPAHAADLSAAGMKGVPIDLARTGTGALGAAMTGVDAVVYAAGPATAAAVRSGRPSTGTPRSVPRRPRRPVAYGASS